MKSHIMRWLMVCLFPVLIGLKFLYVLSDLYEHVPSFSELNYVSVVLTAMLVSLLTYFLFPKKFFFILIFLDFFYSFILFSNTLYFRNFGDYWSIQVLFYIGQLKDVSGSIGNLFQFRDLLIFVDIPLLMILFRWKQDWRMFQEKKDSLTVKISKWIMMVVFIFSVIGYSSISSIHTFQERNSNRHIVDTVGFANFYLQDIYYLSKRIFTNEKMSEKEFETIIQSFKPIEDIQKGDNFGAIKGQNIIYLQLESMSQYLMNKSINGKEITPVLNELAKNNYSSPSMFKQIGAGHTSDAEYVSLSGLYPSEKESVSVMYANNEYYTIAHVLKEQGYETVSAHGYRKEFWNRQNSHKSYGFNQSWFLDDYQVNEGERGFIGIEDAPFYEKTISRLSEIEQPFFAHIISLECHSPFDVKEEDKELNVGELEGTLMGNYLHSSHLADKAVGVLMEELKATGLDKNTTIVVFGDHDAELENKWNELFLGQVDQVKEIHMTKVPFIVITPNGELKGEQKHVIGQIDIAPSVLHLMGVVPTKSYFYGRNMFNEEEPFMVRLPKGSIVTDDELLLMDKSTFSVKLIDLKTEKEIEVSSEWESNYNQFQQEYAYSEKIIHANFIKTTKKH